MAFGKSRPSSQLTRKSRGFNELPRILLVCEGAKTEPNYFNSLIRTLGLRAASIIVVGAECESAPISVYEYAARRFKEERGINEVYCIFDRDRHQTFDAACDAIQRHPSQKFRAIISDPCFEFWLLLHFKYTRKPFVAQGGRSPGEVVLKELLEQWPDYAKGKLDVFASLKDTLDKASTGSRMARADATSTGERNPSTEVDILIDRLTALAKEQLKPSVE